MLWEAKIGNVNGHLLWKGGSCQRNRTEQTISSFLQMDLVTPGTLSFRSLDLHLTGVILQRCLLWKTHTEWMYFGDQRWAFWLVAAMTVWCTLFSQSIHTVVSFCEHYNTLYYPIAYGLSTVQIVWAGFSTCLSKMDILRSTDFLNPRAPLLQMQPGEQVSCCVDLFIL